MWQVKVDTHSKAGQALFSPFLKPRRHSLPFLDASIKFVGCSPLLGISLTADPDIALHTGEETEVLKLSGSCRTFQLPSGSAMSKPGLLFILYMICMCVFVSLHLLMKTFN